MYLIGFFIYLFTIASFFIFPAMRFLFKEAITLAPEVAGAVCVVCIYPLVIFLVHIIRKKKSYESKLYLTSQAKLAASLSVSLGLIGTFQGLTDMVSTISRSMQSGGDDLVGKMSSMISSISSALASMSYAFITSIFGVASSVIILLSLNYMSTYYNKKDVRDKLADEEYDISKQKLEQLSEEISRLSKINVLVSERLLACNLQNEFIDEGFKKYLEIISYGNELNEKSLKSLTVFSGAFQEKTNYLIEQGGLILSTLVDIKSEMGRWYADDLIKELIDVFEKNKKIDSDWKNKIFISHESLRDSVDDLVATGRNAQESLSEISYNSIKMSELLMGLNEKEKFKSDKMKRLAEALIHE
ncbi:MotA/TolQ/ExbB proton channel family protein [Salmonella enterica]|nr:MotA/TolQ/ExbB proton channel family protein [Salmonella enterica]EKC5774517.1 MotA/TolQ/ExbB proton channel family protein [Salmonella enterica]EKC5969412.1 MotA/TolQ/ExbB proton channel family protein [Salmonella enterica]